VHGLFAAAGEDGQLECFDLRARSSVGLLDAAAAAGAPGAGLTALRFDDSGMNLAAGTSNGLVALFDLRSSRPLVVKDHMYGDAIRDIKWHVSGGGGGALSTRRVVSTDNHAIKVGSGRQGPRRRGEGGWGWGRGGGGRRTDGRNAVRAVRRAGDATGASPLLPASPGA
jgi:WD40 repeat protein